MQAPPMLVAATACILAMLHECVSVRFAYLGVPGFVLQGEPVWLDCGYDLEGNELYSVKWYKDNVEFYRFLPSDKPSAQMYKLDGVFLDLDHSNATHAFLYTSEMQTEGMYGCEVSTEMPQFRTIKAEKELYVYVIPEGEPVISGVQSRYPIGAAVNATCTFGPSKPAAQLTWTLNGVKAPDTFVKNVLTETLSSDSKTSISRLLFIVEPKYLKEGTLNIECIASVSLVHSKSSIELIVTDGIPGTEFQHVPHVPPGVDGPSITGGSPRYFLGDMVDVNCSSARSPHPAKLHWFLNDNEVTAEFLSSYPATVYPDGLSSSKLGLRFRVQDEHFRSEEMRLKCTATLATPLKMAAAATAAVGPLRTSGYQVSRGWSCRLIEWSTVGCLALVTSCLGRYSS